MGSGPAGLPSIHQPLSTDVLDLLTSLADKSLVQCAAGEKERRYRLLETVREYAWEKLREVGEAERVQRQHLEYFLRLAEEAEPELEAAQQVRWLERLEAEHGNFRAALARGWEAEPARALRLAGALALFWELRGYWHEGRSALERGLALAGDAPLAARAKASRAAGGLAGLCLGNAERWKELAEESLELSRKLGDRREIGRSLYMMGCSIAASGSPEEGRALLEESLGIARETGDRWTEAWALFCFGGAARARGDYEAARPIIEECRAVARKQGAIGLQGWALAGLARLASAQGNDTAARRLLEQALAHHRRIGSRGGELHSLRDLAAVAWGQRAYEAARGYHEESMAIARMLGVRSRIHQELLDLGSVALAQEEYAQARTHFAESLTVAKEMAEAGGDKQGIVASLWGMVQVDLVEQDIDAAHAYAEESMAVARELGIKQAIAWALSHRADVAEARGDYATARELLRESLVMLRELGDKTGITRLLEGFASLAAAQGEAERAARLLGASEASLELINYDRWKPLAPRWCSRELTALRAALDEAALASAWAEGRDLALEEAVAYALEGAAGPC